MARVRETLLDSIDQLKQAQAAPQLPLESPAEKSGADVPPDSQGTPGGSTEAMPEQLPQPFVILSSLLHELPKDFVDKDDLLEAAAMCGAAFIQEWQEAERLSKLAGELDSKLMSDPHERRHRERLEAAEKLMKPRGIRRDSGGRLLSYGHDLDADTEVAGNA
jgi:hypothetical protein